jgi:signal recognition particle GTPase
MVVGVNGVGKTTTIGKLANQFKQQAKMFFSAPRTPSGQQPLNS